MNNKVLMVLFLTTVGMFILYGGSNHVYAEDLKETFSTKIYDEFYIKN